MPRAPNRGPVSPSPLRSVGSTTRQRWSTLTPRATPSPRGMKSTIVPASTRTEGNGASPARHSSNRTGSNASVSRYQATDRSTSATTSTRWSNPCTRTCAMSDGMQRSMIEQIVLDHVALATEHQRDAWPRYRGDLAGIWLGDGGDLQGFLSSQARYANGMKVELLEPYRVEANDFLRRYLDRNGPGPHHLTYKVTDIVSALEETEAAGYRPVNVNITGEDWKEAFLHPKDAPGIVVQLAQAARTGRGVAEPADNDPEPRVDRPASLLRVVHAVRSMDEGMRLFAGLLGGEEVGRGADEAATWVDLAWPGPGRIRLLSPTDDSSPVSSWLGSRAGRLHHLAFAVDRPGEVPDAVALSDGSWEVPPERNLGVRLVLFDAAT